MTALVKATERRLWLCTQIREIAAYTAVAVHHTQYTQVAKNALSLARAMRHLHTTAIDGYVLMHRDLKPDNLAFSITKVCIELATVALLWILARDGGLLLDYTAT
jgi:serine/threonine protein kinase